MGKEISDWNDIVMKPGILYKKDGHIRLICEELGTGHLFSVDLGTGKMKLPPKRKEQFIKDLNRIKATPSGVYEMKPKPDPKRYEKLEPGMIRDGVLVADGGRGWWYLIKDLRVWKSGSYDEMLAVMNYL